MEQKSAAKIVLYSVVVGLIFVAGFITTKVAVNILEMFKSSDSIYVFAVIFYTSMLGCMGFLITKRIAPNKLKFKQNWHQFSKVDPFGFVDNLNLRFYNVDFNIFQKWKTLRKSLLAFALIAGLIWAVAGFDSCMIQVEKLATSLPSLLAGRITFNEWINIYHSYYGREMHWSAIVIYGLMFVGLSYYFEKKLGIERSKNLAYSIGMTLFSIPFFEFFWMLSYSHFQKQTWVVRLQAPQLWVILQNIQFLIVGAVVILYMYADKLRLRFDKITASLMVVSLCAILFWWNYPGYVEQFTVQTDVGPWSNSTNFPQTLYTVEINVKDGLCNGEWYYKENDAVHGINTLTKVLFTLTVFNIARVKRRW